MDDTGWSTTNRGRIEECTGKRDMWINIVLGEGKLMYGGQFLGLTNEN
jgi:hypothetical protein